MTKISTVQDTFPGTSFSGTWSASGAAVTCNNGVTMSNPSGSTAYPYLQTVIGYDCTNSQSIALMTSAGDQTLVSHETFPLKWFVGGGTDANTNVTFHINQNLLTAAIDNGTSTSYFGSVTYNPTLHRYFMLQETAGTTYWWTSADGQHFNLLYSVADPFVLTAAKLVLQSGTYNSELTSTTATWANEGFYAPVVPTRTARQAIKRAAFY